MRTVRFYKVTPGGNPTILILDPVPALERAAVARELLDSGHLQAEQVGYLDLDAIPVRLDMMGGEFCGNACRASVAVMALEGRGLEGEGGELRGTLSVSGAEEPVAIRLVADECWVEMPLPAEVADGSELAPGVGVVRLPGITHLLLDEERHPFPADYAAAAAMLREVHGLDGEAVGCIWYAAAKEYAIKPVVWVRSTASTYYETGCGSGSLALALWLGTRQNLPATVFVRQPAGGSIGVTKRDGRAWIHGPVTVVARGETYLTSSFE